MKKYLTLIVFIFVGEFLSSQMKLAYDVYYYKNPQHIQKNYDNILVITNAPPQSKKALLVAIENSGYKVTLAQDIFPPIKKYSDSEVSETIANLGIDAILYYTILGTSVTETGTYGSYSIPLGGTGSFSSYKTTHNYTSIEAALVEPNTKDIKEIYYYGGANCNSIDVSYRVFNKILKQLEETGIAFAAGKK